MCCPHILKHLLSLLVSSLQDHFHFNTSKESCKLLSLHNKATTTSLYKSQVPNTSTSPSLIPPRSRAENCTNMVSALDTVQATSRSVDQPSSPRISFSSEFLDDNFISNTPNPQAEKDEENMERDKARNPEFEFLSSNMSSHNMLTADELFFEGKLLPFWQMQYSEKLNRISLKTKESEGQKEEGLAEVNKEETRVSWLVDDEQSPRPPTCTVLWKELLRLKKQRASSLSPSSSSSSTSSSSSSLADIVTTEGKGSSGNNSEKHVKRVKKVLERTRSASIRIRPMITVPICTQVKSSALRPLFPLKKGRLER